MFVVIADLHLGLSLDCKIDVETGLPIKTKETVRALYKVAKFCKLNNANLIIAGDVFEKSNPKPIYERLLVKYMNYLDESGIQTRIISGNHDVSRLSEGALRPFAEYKFKNVKFYNDVGNDVLGGINFIFAPYIPKHISIAPEQYITERVSELVQDGIDNVIVCHHVFEGAVWNNQVDLSFADANQRFDSVETVKAIVSGHIHKRQIVKNKGKSPVYYVGSLIQNDITERGDHKGFMVFDDLLESTFYRLKSHEYYKVSVKDKHISDSGFDEKWLKKWLERVSDKIVHIGIEVSRENYNLKLFSELESQIKEKAFYLAKTVVSVIEGLSEEEVNLESVDIKGLITETIDGLSVSKAVKGDLEKLSDEIYSKVYEEYSQSFDE